MANICEFKMMVRGSRENINAFTAALTQQESVWIGRGAEVYDSEMEADERCVTLNGDCKWSVESALVNCAKSMREQPDRWADLPKDGEFLTIFEACEKFRVNMELYSKEPGMCFQEHFLYQDGKIIDETCDWIPKWDHETGDMIGEEGGYPDWNFTVTDVPLLS